MREHIYLEEPIAVILSIAPDSNAVQEIAALNSAEVLALSVIIIAFGSGVYKS